MDHFCLVKLLIYGILALFEFSDLVIADGTAHSLLELHSLLVILDLLVDIIWFNILHIFRSKFLL